MYLKFNRDNYKNHLAQFQSLLGGELINENHLYLDNDKAKGHILVFHTSIFQFTILNFELKVDVILEFHNSNKFDYTAQFFGQNLIYEYSKQDPIQFSIPYGFFLFKKADKIYLDFNKGDKVQQASLYFSNDHQTESTKGYLDQLNNFMYHEGEEHLRNWKRSIFHYKPVHETLMHDWLMAKSNELYVYFQDAIRKVVEEDEKDIHLDYEVDIVFKLKDNIINNLKQKPNVADLAIHHGINITKLENIFKMMFNDTIYQFYKKQRIVAVKNEIENTSKLFTELAYDYGFTDVNHLSKNFKKTFGVTPTQFRNIKND